ncbi:MAG: histidine phosphatase family protein [Oscillospiraceae bacterium]|nr:histidine phosphatase family protein [Oscillospiraceae bacterium]
MTTLYFIRHAEPNYDNPDDMTRELTENGLRDRYKAKDFLADCGIDLVLSSPYKRSVDTVRPIADAIGQQEIETYYDLRERTVCDEWLYCFDDYAKNQWSDFSYKLEGGECLGEVQARNVAAINEILKKYGGRTIAIGSHGTALSTIIHHYSGGRWGFDDFQRIKKVMPFIVKLVFEGENCTCCEVYEKL